MRWGSSSVVVIDVVVVLVLDAFPLGGVGSDGCEGEGGVERWLESCSIEAIFVG